VRTLKGGVGLEVAIAERQVIGDRSAPGVGERELQCRGEHRQELVNRHVRGDLRLALLVARVILAEDADPKWIIVRVRHVWLLPCCKDGSFRFGSLATITSPP